MCQGQSHYNNRALAVPQSAAYHSRSADLYYKHNRYVILLHETI